MSYYDNFLSRDDATFLGNYLIFMRYKLFLKIIKSHFKSKEPKVLEIGPGKGKFAEFCKKNNLRYVGIEANKVIADRLSSKGLEVFVGSVPPIQINKKFDIIYFDQVLEHMNSKKEAFLLMAECYKKLEDDGLIIIRTPDITYWGSDFYIPDYTHSFPVSKESINQLGIDSGFAIFHLDSKIIFFKFRPLLFLTSLIAKFLFKTGLLRLISAKKELKLFSLLMPQITYIGIKK
jgi:SAM-dependent methyltransferase